MAEYIEKEKAMDAVRTSFPYSGLGRMALGNAVKALRYVPAADVVSASDFRDCRNELCLKCGAYTKKHLGACDGCRWRDA